MANTAPMQDFEKHYLMLAKYQPRVIAQLVTLMTDQPVAKLQKTFS
jgi:hypothetical protein